MHMSPRNVGASRNWNQWGVITLAIGALLVLTHCDGGFVPDAGPPPNSSDVRAQAIQEWYHAALTEEQDAPLTLSGGMVGKISEDSTIAAVLAAMVRQYPPDWDQMETWDN